MVSPFKILNWGYFFNNEILNSTALGKFWIHWTVSCVFYLVLARYSGASWIVSAPRTCKGKQCRGSGPNTWLQPFCPAEVFFLSEGSNPWQSQGSDTSFVSCLYMYLTFQCCDKDMTLQREQGHQLTVQRVSQNSWDQHRQSKLIENLSNITFKLDTFSQN